MTATIGAISLNIALVLYLINYFPQLVHNKRGKYIAHFSVYYHVLLYMSCITDLFYGIGMHMPWQYKTVSCCWVGYLSIQHYQLRHVLKNYMHGLLLFLLCIGVLALLFFNQHKEIFIICGFLTQGTALIYAFPQIIKNIGTQAALSLSISRLSIDLLSKICDNISAHIFAWPLPSLLGAALSVIVCGVLVFQWISARQERDGYILHEAT